MSTKLIAQIALAAFVLLTASASADLISVADCYVINSNPDFLSCSQYTEPYTDLLGALPYDTVPEYTQCVRERCVCNEEQTDVNSASWTTDGIHCSSAGWNETGEITCNQMVECFGLFWRCTLNALMDRSNAQATLDAAETAAVNAIIAHGTTPGADFRTTDMFYSCRMAMCEAAASRTNCGLLTCVPNSTQCYEYIKPPPLPDVHQLCTQGCRAVLILMALTITTFASSIACCACCPAPVVENEPLLGGEDEGNEEKRERGEESPDAKSHASSQQQNDQDENNATQ